MAPRSSLDRVLSHPALVWIGVRSYALYLVHFPVFLAVTPDRFSSIPRPVFLVVRVGLAVLLSDALHQLIEVPVAKLRKRAEPRAAQLVPSMVF